jgi:adenylate cyclase
MRGGLGISLVEIEAARGLRERPTTPDAFDVILRARSLINQPPSLEHFARALALYEQALVLEPNSAVALAGAGTMLIYERLDRGYWDNLEKKTRVETYLAHAREIAPASEEVRTFGAWWLESERRWQDAMAAARQLVEMYPNSGPPYTILGMCYIETGNAEEYIPLMRKWLRLNPRSPTIFQRIRHMGTSSLLLGHDKEAIEFLEQSLAMSPTDARIDFRQATYRMLSAAYARIGQDVRSRKAMAEADRLWPFDTVRAHDPGAASNTAKAVQVRRIRDGLRLAGERDHAEEDADFGIPPDAVLHSSLSGYTPASAPGVTTIRTPELQRLLNERNPLVIDALTNSWGHSIPGAVGLPNVGSGGTLTDRSQDRLRHKMAELTGRDLTRPIVAVGWNSERFDGRNLALRLVALGYANVFWYRGGREAWEVAGLPEAELQPQDW